METNPQAPSVPGTPSKNTTMAVIAYILFFVPLLTDAKKDPFVKYHVKQGLALFVCALAVSLFFQVLPFLFAIAWVLDILVIVLLVIGIMNASRGEQKPLPIIGKFAEKINF